MSPLEYSDETRGGHGATGVWKRLDKDRLFHPDFYGETYQRAPAIENPAVYTTVGANFATAIKSRRQVRPLRISRSQIASSAPIIRRHD